MHEDAVNGQLVCYECGYCEPMLISDHPTYVDLQHATVVTKSVHKPAQYVKALVRKFGIDSKLEPQLLRRYQAVIFWSDRFKPPGRKSLPNYRKCDVASVVVTAKATSHLFPVLQPSRYIGCCCSWANPQKPLRSSYPGVKRSEIN